MIGDAFRRELHDRTGRDFRTSILGLYPPRRRAWPWLNVSLGESRFGSQPTTRPQLNVEVGAEGLDIFYSVDLRATAGAAAAVRARVRERRGDPALLEGAVAAGYGEVQEDEAGRYMVRRRIPRATAIGWAGLGIDELAAELDLLLPIYEAMAAEPATAAAREPAKGATVDPRFEELASALEDRGQVILYGPPGTGKTWTAYRFALWWLTKHWGGNADAVLADPAQVRAADTRFTRAQRERRVWWVVANPTEWSWEQLFTDGTVDYRYGRLKSNYELIQPGDLVIGYQANPDKRVVALARIAQSLHDTDDGQKITLEPIRRVANGLTYEELLADPVLAVSEPARFRNQGTLFRLTSTEADLVLARLAERDPALPDLEAGDPAEGMGPLTRVTFHPTYGYEDFVEGFRPVPTTTGQLSLELTPGVFKRVCQAARTNAERRPYLLLIDEINRGNIPKIFGELITLIERDKRDQSAVLPQSGDPFAVPPNVYLVGTMNTADRSIRLLDAALRRRFSFIELMPDSTTLGNARIGDLELAHFLDELNLRVTKRHGREKQVGHSFLLEGGKPITTATQFSARFRREILPLLQEYTYDDFRELGEYLGPELIDAELQRVAIADLTPDALVSALAVEYGGAKDSDVAEVG
jgi:5-methylcytosine-specific restriction protein B